MPTGSRWTNWQAAEASRVNGFNFSSIIGGGTSLRTGGLNTSGLLTGQAYDADVAKKRQAARNAQPARGTQVTAPDVVQKLEDKFAGLHAKLDALMNE